MNNIANIQSAAGYQMMAPSGLLQNEELAKLMSQYNQKSAASFSGANLNGG